MEMINPQEWKKDLPAFKEKTDRFYAGELSKADYKGFSGGYGSYAQKDGKASMIRLRMAGGHLTKDKLKFIVMLKSIACGNGYLYNILNLMKGESVLC